MTLTGEIPPNVIGFHTVDLLWTLADSRRARREGWDICSFPRAGLFITDMTSNLRLKAVTHCVAMADVSKLHARALTIHFHSLATREK